MSRWTNTDISLSLSRSICCRITSISASCSSVTRLAARFAAYSSTKARISKISSIFRHAQITNISPGIGSLFQQPHGGQFQHCLPHRSLGYIQFLCQPSLHDSGPPAYTHLPQSASGYNPVCCSAAFPLPVAVFPLLFPAWHSPFNLSCISKYLQLFSSHIFLEKANIFIGRIFS